MFAQGGPVMFTQIRLDKHTLQTILGHESLDMVERYLKIAQTDLQKAHQDASPVMNWLL
jgi:site-specific recombinase XerD